MNKLLTIIAVLGMTSAAMAADLPSKSAPLPPVRPAEASLPYFVGVNAGGIHGSEDYTLGLTIGSNINENFATEVAFDHLHDLGANQVAGNVILQSKVGDITPYALAGVGYRWADNNEAVWNVGGGAKVALTNTVDFDARYRYVQGFDTKNSDNIVTGGLVFKF